ncbi:hypothetical protein KAW18_15925 [candidate division WOR-3 bacterium]|nr:hypothetical protein [candidate division WOR-3 bacterium]
MQVKGTAVCVLPKFIIEYFGKNELQEWLDSLTPVAQDVFNSHILASKWFSLNEILVEPTKKALDLFYNGDIKGALEIGRFSADYGLKGVYKAFVRIATPQALMTRSSHIMSSYYKPSTMEPVSMEKHGGVLHITEFPEPSKIVEYRILGWIERALEICGCKDIKLEITKSLVNQDPYTEFVGSWK